MSLGVCHSRCWNQPVLVFLKPHFEVYTDNILQFFANPWSGTFTGSLFTKDTKAGLSANAPLAQQAGPVLLPNHLCMFARLFFFTVGYLTGALCVASMVAGRVLPGVLPTFLKHCVSSWGCRWSAGNVGSWMVRAEPGQGHACLLVAWFLLLSWHPVTSPAHSPEEVCVLRNERLQALLISAHALGVLWHSAPEACILLLIDWAFTSPAFFPLACSPWVGKCRNVQGFLGSLLFPGLPTAMEWGQELFYATRFFCFCSWHMQCKIDFIFLVWFLSFCLISPGVFLNYLVFILLDFGVER